MKSKIHKILGVVLTLVLLGSLTAGMAVPAAAQGPANVWGTVAAVGDLGGLFTSGSPPGMGTLAGPGPMEKAIDGTLYAFVDKGLIPSAPASNLVKSSDGGHTWQGCSTPTDDLGFIGDVAGTLPIVAIACSPNDANTLYVATANNLVYRSTDAGATFTVMTAPIIAGNITCMDVGYSGGTHWIVIGTSTGAFGGEVYMRSDAFGSPWIAQLLAGAYGGVDVLALSCSPNFSTEANPQIIAIISSITGNTYATFQYGAGGWNSGSTADVMLFAGTTQAADIAFPADYNSAYPAIDFFVAIDDGLGGGGDVYRVYPGIAYDQNIRGIGTNTDVNTIAVAGSSGSCKVLAAGRISVAVPGTLIYHTENDSLSWNFSLKGVACTTANTFKYIVMDDDYFNNGTAVVATASTTALDESSIAQTMDFGVSWTDIGLVDTPISQIMNLALSPNHGTDGIMFLITSSGGVTLDSLWKFDGAFWSRVATMPNGNAATAAVQCSPDYDPSAGAVFLYDTVLNQIFRATDGGTWFLPQVGAPTPIAAVGTFGWQVIDSSHLVVGDFARILYTSSNGTTWIPSDPLPGPPNTVVSFAISADGTTMLAGGSAGGVYKSDDAGATWGGAAPPSVTGIAGAGALSVAFDPDDPFTIYAADAGTNGVWRLTFPGDTMWRRIDTNTATTWPGASTPGGALNTNPLVPGIQVAPDGTLYATDTSTLAGVPGVGGADIFTITGDPADAFTFGGAIDAGNINVNAGSVIITTTGTANIADTFTVTNGPAASNGVITVTAGSALATPAGGATVNGGTAAVTITPAAAATWGTAAGAGTVTVEALSQATVLNITRVAGNATATITYDNNGNIAWPGPPGFGGWTLPDGSAGPFAAPAVVPWSTAAAADTITVTAVVDGTAVNVTSSGAPLNISAVTDTDTDATINTLLVPVAGLPFIMTGADTVGLPDGPATANLFISSGSLMVTSSSTGVVFNGVAAPFSVPIASSLISPLVPIPMVFPAAGGVITFTATTANTTGVWAPGVGSTTALITGNLDGDESVAPLGGSYGLVDIAGAAPGAAAGAPVVLRSINPSASVTSPRGVYFEPMNTAFTGNPTALVGVWCIPGSNTVFTLESVAGGSAIWVYEDSLTVEPSLSDPPDGTDTGRTTTALLSWDGLPDCPLYEIWVAPNPDFSPVIIDGFSNTASFMAQNLQAGVTYYWKVCSAASTAATPGRALSPWSEDWTFTTGLAGAEWNPFADAENVAPAPGATGVSVSPAFQWNPADWATGYEFVLADNPDFNNPLAEETVTTPVYLYSGTLAYSTTYYWKVRAISATSESVWATGTFTTMDKPVPPAEPADVVVEIPPTEEITPAWIWAIVIIGAILVIAVIVLIVTTRRVP